MEPLPLVATWVRREVVGSTNDLAGEIVATEDVECPLLVTATRQTRGRGRASRTWWSDEGSLTFSVALDPSAHGLRVEHEPRVALAAAVAVIDAVSPRLATVGLGIRWPNDIEAGGKKLGGILPERVETPRGVRLVIGIGLNVSTRLEAAPVEVRSMATSLAELDAAAPAPDLVLRRILDALWPSLTLLAVDDAGLAVRWNELDTLRGQAVRLDLGPRIVRGIGRGIDASGALLLESAGAVVPHFGGQVLRSS